MNCEQQIYRLDQTLGCLSTVHVDILKLFSSFFVLFIIIIVVFLFLICFHFGLNNQDMPLLRGPRASSGTTVNSAEISWATAVRHLFSPSKSEKIEQTEESTWAFCRHLDDAHTNKISTSKIPKNTDSLHKNGKSTITIYFNIKRQLIISKQK